VGFLYTAEMGKEDTREAREPVSAMTVMVTWFNRDTIMIQIFHTQKGKIKLTIGGQPIWHNCPLLPSKRLESVSTTAGEDHAGVENCFQHWHMTIGRVSIIQTYKHHASTNNDTIQIDTHSLQL
jgi:hypothetical protein